MTCVGIDAHRSVTVTGMWNGFENGVLHRQVRLGDIAPMISRFPFADTKLDDAKIGNVISVRNSSASAAGDMSPRSSSTDAFREFVDLTAQGAGVRALLLRPCDVAVGCGRARQFGYEIIETAAAKACR